MSYADPTRLILARISHHRSTADADPRVLTGRTPSGRLDVVSATPAVSSGPCTPSVRRPGVLATNGGEKCGLAPHSQNLGRRAWLQLFLALFLLLAQTGLFLHELEHQSTAPDTYCALCLAAQHLGDALHTAASLGISSIPALPPVLHIVPVVHAEPGVPFSARAPPVPLSSDPI